jgi:hypothetical protein
MIGGAKNVQGMFPLPFRMVFPDRLAEAVIAKDNETHMRNVPDARFGQIFSSIQKPNDSWTVKVGTFRTSFEGAPPGNRGPFDVATYTVTPRGKVTVAAPAA